MQEAKKGKCEKCGLYFYIHAHHVLPKSIFGKKTQTTNLCPNCHTHFHEYSKKHTKNPENKQEAFKLWSTWLSTVAVVVSCILLLVFIVDFL